MYANGVKGSDNSAGVITDTATALADRVVVRPPELGPMSGPYATGLARHPTLQVAYLLDGDNLPSLRKRSSEPAKAVRPADWISGCSFPKIEKAGSGRSSMG